MGGFSFKIERLRRGLTQWELARLTDIPPYRLSAFEQGRVQLSAEERERISKALDAVDPMIDSSEQIRT